MIQGNRGLGRYCRLLFIFLVIGLSFGSSLDSQESFFSPGNPPASRYLIDARIDPEKGVVEGKESVLLKNASRRPISIVAFDWSIGSASSLSVTVKGKSLTLINADNGAPAASQLFYRLPASLKPGVRVKLDIAFKMSFDPPKEGAAFQLVRWYPRLWWDGLPQHDAFSVKLDIPKDYALAVSGRLNKATGRYEAEGGRTFGIYLAKNLKTESREVAGVLITALFTEKGAKAAAACLDTAADAVKFFTDWLGFYPYPFLFIIPGGRGRWGGYPVATGIVAIHGLETFKEGESLLHWQRITSHEIGHEYWGEWVLDPDQPAWVWIGMGIFADTEYMLSRQIDPERRINWMGNYVNGISRYYDMTVDIPPAQEKKIKYDHNNTVIHSKCPSIIFALDSLLGRATFETIYKKALREYGGRRLGWRELQNFFEKEGGQNLSWFFDQWVRSNKYLCYKIEAQESKQEGSEYLSMVKVRRLGTMKMPVPVKAVSEDGTVEVKSTDRNLDVNLLTFRSRGKLKEVILDPDHKLARLKDPLPEIPKDAAEALAWGWDRQDSFEVYEKIKKEEIKSEGVWHDLGIGLYEGQHFAEAFSCFKNLLALQPAGWLKFAALAWMGLLKDLLGERREALDYYGEALKADEGEPVEYGHLKIRFDRPWLEERLKTPFTRGK